MPTELIVPAVGESITEAQIANWVIKVGEWVAKDDTIVEIETDKVTFEFPAPVSGVITEILKPEGEFATVGECIGYMEEKASAEGGAKAPADKPAASPTESPKSEPTPDPAPEAPKSSSDPIVMPAAQKAMNEGGISKDQVTPTGPGNRILKEDVQKAATTPAPPKPAPLTATAPAASAPVQLPPYQPTEEDEVVPMSPIRRRIAQRLVQAQQSAAMLTTFNEVDMSQVMALRKAHQDSFIKKHGIKLGFMSFFVKACCDALQEIPNVNAQIYGNNIIYKKHCHVGVAIGGGKGLVVPVIRKAETLGFADVEKSIIDYATKVKENKLAISDMEGGTFTISNGGVYGSMLSTPILNTPQSAILGLHNIQQRAMVVDGEIVIRPMMYLALTYDHRIVDGREAVTFLKRVKEVIETPARLMISC